MLSTAKPSPATVGEIDGDDQESKINLERLDKSSQVTMVDHKNQDSNKIAKLQVAADYSEWKR